MAALREAHALSDRPEVERRAAGVYLHTALVAFREIGARDEAAVVCAALTELRQGSPDTAFAMLTLMFGNAS